MSRLGAADQARIHDLCGTLGTLVDRGPSGLALVLPELANLLGAEKAVAYAFAPLSDSLKVDFWHSIQLPADARLTLDQWLVGKTVGWAGFNPIRPQPNQRNLALTLDQIAKLAGRSDFAVVRELFPKFGLDHKDQLRVLVCDGPSLLAYIGGWRAEPFTRRDRLVLQALVPALQRRLKLERLLGQASLTAATLDATLEQLAAPALLVRSGEGDVCLANSAGHTLLDRDRRSVIESIRAAIRGASHAFSVTRIGGSGLAEHFLLVQRAPASEKAGRLALAVRRWNLTPRQREVLSRVAGGMANRTVAADLGCAESTVELHVTSLLEKSDSASRAELIAKFWSQP